MGSSGRLITAPGCVLVDTTGVLASPASSANFGLISQAYTTLEIRISGRSAVAAVAETVRLQINGVATATYYSQAMTAVGAAPAAAESLGQTSADIGTVPGATALANVYGTVVAQLPGYTRATSHKTVHGTSYVYWNAGTGNQQILLKGATYTGGAAAITTLYVFPATAQWAAGSVISLYGYI